MYVILHVIILTHICDYIWVLYVLCPSPLCFLLLPPEGWVEGEGLILTTLAAQGAEFCSAKSGTEGRGLSLGQRSQSLAEGKEGVQGGWSGVWQAVLGQQRLAAVGRVPSCSRSPLHPVRAHTLASILGSQCPGQGEQAIGTCFLPLVEIFWSQKSLYFWLTG